MSSNKNYFDLIDSYLNGEMSQGQIDEFESQLRQDPLLENEFQLQKDIVDSIKNFRHAELKATLDAVEIGGTAFSAVKIAAGIGLLALLGVGFYYLGGTDKNQNQEIATENTIQSPITQEGNLDEVDNSETTAATETPIPEEIIKEAEDKAVALNDDIEPTVKSAENSEVEEKAKEAVEAPSITLPEVVENFDESNDNQLSENIKVPVNKMQQVTETYIPKTAVIEMDNGKYAFHYQFYDNKLYLYGDFENKYEILELNTPDGISIYMFYNDQFYELKQNQEKIKPLESIKDNSLIEDLKTIKEN